MLNVGFSEILLFAIIAILILGPDKLTQAIRALVKLKRKFEMLKQRIHSTLQKELELNQLKTALDHDQQYIVELEKRLDAYLNTDIASRGLSKQRLIQAGECNHRTQELKARRSMVCLGHYKLYPVDDWPKLIPFQPDFLLVHLMSWRCFRF